MKIHVDAGRVARLPDRRTTSVRGGVYDVGDLTADQKQQLLAQPGVREVRASTRRTPAPSEE